MKFPITALALANLAQERLEQQGETVRSQMVGDYLPRTVDVILSRQEDCRQIIKSWDSETAVRIINSAAQALWSNPGSMGGLQIERQLIANGVSREDADTLATNIIKYSRYSMSVVNSLRHYKSAVSGVRDIIEPIQFRERYLSSPSLPAELQSVWPPKAEEFGAELFKNAGDITEWLTRIESFIAEVTSASNWARRRVLQEQDPNGWRKVSSMNISMAKAYTRRYGRFLMQEFKEINFGGRYVPISKKRNETILEELSKLKSKLFSDDKTVFKLFEEDYDERSHRITSLASISSRPAFRRNSSDFSYFENYISNQFKLEGRDLTVRSKPEKVSSDLINQMYKLFLTQLEIEPNMGRFESKAERDGQSLVVELDQPKKSDAAKLKQLLTKLLTR